MKRMKQNMRTFIMIVLGLSVIAMLFLPVLVYSDTNTSFTGYEVIFGTEFASLGIFGSGQIEFSILGILAFMLPIAAALVASLSYKNNGAMTAILLFAAGAVLLFLLPIYIVTSVTVLGQTTPIDITWQMGVGLIVAASASVLGACVAAITAFSKR